MPKPPPFASGPSVFELDEVTEVKLNTWCKGGCGPGSWPAPTTSTTAGEVVAGNQPPLRIPRCSVYTSLMSEAVVSCDLTGANGNKNMVKLLKFRISMNFSQYIWDARQVVPSLSLYLLLFLCFFLSSFPSFLCLSFFFTLSLSLSFSTCEYEVVCPSNPQKYILNIFLHNVTVHYWMQLLHVTNARVVGYLQGLTGLIAPKNGCCWWMESNYGCASRCVQQS